jgi:hypothetical protein
MNLSVKNITCVLLVSETSFSWIWRVGATGENQFVRALPRFGRAGNLE